MNNTVYATFTDPEMAKKAMGALLDYGIRAEHISVVLPEGYTDKSDRNLTDQEEKFEHQAESGITTTTSADAASGAAKGAGIGLAAGALAALASVFIPGIGLVVGGGALALAIGGLAGTTAAGAVAGGVTGYLKDQGLPEEAVSHYENTLVSGGAVMTVSPTDENLAESTIEEIIGKYQGVTSRYPANASTTIDVPNRSILI